MTTTKLTFETGALSIYDPDKTAPTLGFTTGNDFVWNPERTTFNIVDIDLGPFGGLKADGYVDFAFGFRFSASLGNPGTFTSSYDISVDVEYPDLVVGDPNNPNITFDFTDVTVTSAESSSVGLGGPVQVDVPGSDKPLSLPAGLNLEMIVGAELGIDNITIRLPFSSADVYDGFALIPFKEQAISLFKLDARKSKISFKLSESIDLTLRLPTGAATSGESQGSTIVGDKGYSPAPFFAIEGDLDKLLVKLIKTIPGVGTVVGKALENTIFVETKEDLSEYIPFIEKDWLTFSTTLVDLSATAGLHVTEEVQVDIGYEDSENLSDLQVGGGSNNVADFVNGLFLDIPDPGEDKTPNVKVVLRSDNGTPDNLLDDQIATGYLGETIDIAKPGANFNAGEVTVDAWFDVERAKVSHSVGLGGKFSVGVSVLSAGFGGSIGEKLGISFGPLFYQEIPDGGLKVDLFNFFTRRFDIEGGSFASLPEDGGVTSANDTYAEWGYEEGQYGQQTAQYKYFFTNIVPRNWDPTDENARQIAIDFALANAKWRQEVIDTFQFVLDANQVDNYIFLNATRYKYTDFTDTNTAVFWDDVTDKLSWAFVEAGQNNVVIAAPQEDTSPAFDGIGTSFLISYELEAPTGSTITVRTYEADASHADLMEFLDFTNDGWAINTFQIEYAKSFSSSIGINVLGTSESDMVVFGSGSRDVKQPPQYLDGGSEPDGVNIFTSEGDVFLANFAFDLPGLAVAWDMLEEQKLEAAASSTSTYSFGNTADANNSISGTVLDFAASILEFRAPGADPNAAPTHQTAVRDFERFTVAFADEADIVRTGINHYEYFEMGGGADRVALSSDKVLDFVHGGDDDDVIILERLEFVPDRRGTDPQATEAIQSLRAAFGSDLIAGGTGFDMVSLTTGILDPDLGSSGGASDGIDASIMPSDLAQGFAWRTDLADADADFIDASSGITDLLEGLDDLLTVFAPGDADRETRDQSLREGVEFFRIATFDNLIFVALAGEGTSGAYIFNDVEGINVEGSNNAADLAIYTGGVYYEGGTAAGETQPVDVFLADFSAYEDVKSRQVASALGTEIVAPGGISLVGSDTLDDNGEVVSRGGIRWTDSSIVGFERWVVRGTSEDDRLTGGDGDDWLEGLGGDDQFSASKGEDYLFGGAGNDVFTLDMEQLGETFLSGDGVPESDLDDVAGEEDRDLLNILYLANKETLIRTVDADGIATDLTSDATEEDALAAIASREDVRAFAVTDADETQVVLAVGIEATNAIGRDAFDDVLLYDGGATYVGGERDNDRDLLIADFSGNAIPLEIVITDEEESGYYLENGVYLAGIDRLIGTLSDGQDLFKGGSLTDIVNGGLGNDTMTGDGGNDTLRGDEDNDFLYYEGDDGFDFFFGGAGTDWLAISNLSETGAAFSTGGIIMNVAAADLQSVPVTIENNNLTADSSTEDVSAILSVVGLNDLSWGITFAGQSDNVLRYTEFEAVDIQGSAEYDDVIVAQGGTMYAGGERAGDRDLFAADYGGESADLTFSTRDAPAGTGPEAAFYDIGNGTQIGEFERLHVLTGFGNDTVTGGRDDDYFDTGFGNDVIVGSLGSDTVKAGGGDDRLSYIGGAQTFDGGADFDRLEIAAQELGYALGIQDIDGFPYGPIVASGIDDVAGYRSVFNDILNLEGGIDRVTLIHAYGGIAYENIEFISATGANAGDVFISGSAGGVISTDGGDDILISDIGDDFLLGGPGSDAYIFGASFGHDVIGNEFAGQTQLHFVGTNLADLTASVDFTGAHLTLTKNALNSVTIYDYFAASTTPTHVTIFADDALTGTTIDVTGLVDSASGVPAIGNQYFGTIEDDILDDFTDGADFYYGFEGDDLFRGNAGPDLFDGSLGLDFVSYETSSEAVFVNLRNAVPAFGGDSAGDLFVSIEGIFGSSFDDGIVGGASGNQLFGGEGNDLIDGGAGDDAVFGGGDNDRLSGGEGDDAIFGGDGNDTVTGTYGSDEGNDTILGGAGDDNLADFEGNNAFSGGAGNDTAVGGSGDDLYTYVGREDRFDPLYDTGIAQEKTGGLDIFEGNGGTDTIDFSQFGAAISAYLETFGGGDGEIETSDADTFTLFGLNNRDLATVSGVENLNGTDFSDVLSGSAADNVITGGFGDDTLVGRDGSDTLIGGGGNDFVNYFEDDGGMGITVVMALTDYDTETEELSFGTVFDNFGNVDAINSIETVIGTSLGDNITGSSSDNTLVGMQGDDTLDGLGGVDTLDYTLEGGNDGVVVDVLFEEATDTFGNSDVIRNFDHYILTEQSDLIYADIERIATIDMLGGNDTAYGSLIEDQISGGSGNDLADMDTGNDIYFYSSGRDTVHGDEGFDIIDYSLGTAPLNVDVFGSLVYRFASAEILTEFTGIEGFIGTSLNDGLYGNNDADYFDGGAGDDDLDGRGGNDTLIGGAGNDNLSGDGNDDELTGGAGNDTASGGAGDDIYYYEGSYVEYEDVSGIVEGQDSFDGGADTDTLSFDRFDSSILFSGTGEAKDIARTTLVTFENVEVLVGTDQADGFVDPSADIELVEGLAGQDFFFGGLTGTTFDGGLDQDTLSYLNLGGSGGIRVDLAAGEVTRGADHDNLVAVERIIGSAGNDTMIGDATDNFFSGGGGYDVYLGGGGSDTVSFLGQGSSFFGVEVALSSNYIVLPLDDFNRPSEYQEGIENIAGTNFEDWIEGDDGANVLEGYDGDDLLWGLGGDDTLIDGDGLDYIEAGAGDDLILSTGGRLVVDGGADNDTLDFSRQSSGVIADLVNGEARTGFTSSFEDIEISDVENLTGSRYVDILIGNAASNVLGGLGGDDTLTAHAGDDTLDGGDGFDIVDYRLEVGLSGVTVDLSFGLAVDSHGDDDVLSGIEGVAGTGRGDLISGDDGNNIVTGHGGADTLDGYDGFDVLDYSRERGNTGINLSLHLELAGDTHGATDQITGFEAVIGSAMADRILGDEIANAISGGAGNDTLWGQGGSDTLTGDAGADQFTHAAGDGGILITDFETGTDTLDLTGHLRRLADRALETVKETDAGDLLIEIEGAGSVTLAGVALADFDTSRVLLSNEELPVLTALDGGSTVDGTEADEVLEGKGGDDTLNAGPGDDIVDGGAGSDDLDGGPGRNKVSYAKTTGGGVTVNFLTGQALEPTGVDTLTGFTEAEGSEQGDSFIGSNAGEVFEGLGGDDVFETGAGEDTVATGEGADTLEGNLGDLDGDKVTDFDEEDTLIVKGETLTGGNVTVTKGSAIFSIDGDGDGYGETRVTFEGDYDTAIFELVTTGSDSEIRLAAAGTTLLSEAGERFITSDETSNRVYGLDDSDFILTAGGADLLIGAEGSDVLVGGDGDDTLSGGLDNDEMTGGAGADVFAFDASDFDGFTIDTVLDFTPGEDRIEVSGFGAISVATATLLSVPGATLVQFAPTSFVQLEGIASTDLQTGDIIDVAGNAAPVFLSITRATNLTDASDRFITTDSMSNVVDAGLDDDFVLTSGGDDALIGGDGSDVLVGGTGADTLTGGLGNDELTGGAGADVFEFVAGGTGFISDTITDFEIGTDRVVLDGYSALPAILSLAGEAAASISAVEFVIFEGLTQSEVSAALEDIFEIV